MTAGREQSQLHARAHEARERAASVAGAAARRAHGSTSRGREAAVLRLFGVSGLDREGRPLAEQVVGRFAQGGPTVLSGGVGLPFAAVAGEYDLAPQETALEIATGYIDPGLEAELLVQPQRRRDAERRIAAWMTAAARRLEANRTARADLSDVLGDPVMPWVGVELGPAPAGEVGDEAAEAIRAGADLVRVAVAQTAAPPGPPGIADLRALVDRLGAEEGRFVRLATSAIGTTAAEAAVEAGFERVDVLFSDPFGSPDGSVGDAELALADQLYALEVLVPSGAAVAFGPGPVVAPELGRGESVSEPTRIGRALALQAVDVELARLVGLPEERVFVTALPADLLADGASLASALVEVELRRLLFPGYRYVVEEPRLPEAAPTWPLALVGWSAGSGPPALVVTGREHLPRRAEELRAAVGHGRQLAGARRLGPLGGPALELAVSALDETVGTLRQLAADGWEDLFVGGAPEAAAPAPPADRLVARRDYFDPPALVTPSPAAQRSR